MTGIKNVKTKLIKYMKNVRGIPTNVHATKPYTSLRKFLVFRGIKTAFKKCIHLYSHMEV
jgi:hypothetical protein